MNLRYAGGAFVIISLFYWIVAISSPSAVGMWHDDAIYLTTAKSMAEETGYRHIETPGQPYQTKWPILYPALLACFFALWPQYPQNMPFLLIPGALAAAGFVVLSIRYLHSLFNIPRIPIIIIGALTILSPTILSLVRFTMSDLPYACLTIAALVCLDLPYDRELIPKRRLLWILLTGLLIVAAMLTRSLGLLLAIAAILKLVIRRRMFHAFLLLAVIGMGMSPWWLWQAWASHANGPMQNAPLLTGDLAYSIWLPHGFVQTARVVWHNVFQIAFGISHFELALPFRLVLNGAEAYSYSTVLSHFIVYSIFVLILTGFIQSWRSSFRTIHLYAVIYGIFILAWPFEPYRFLTPWLPFLIAALFKGIDTLFRCSRLLPSIVRLPDPPAKMAISALGAALLLFFIWDDVQLFGSSPTSYYYYRTTYKGVADLQAINQYIISNTSPDEVVASICPARLFLATGRQGVCLWHDNDPYGLYYGSDRQWRQFYALSAPSEVQLQYQQLCQDLPDVYRQMNVRCLLVSPPDVSPAFIHYVQQNPSFFDLKYKSPHDTYRLFLVVDHKAIKP